MIIQPPYDNHSQTGVTNLWAVTHTWPLFFPHHPYAYREAVDAYLQRHPYTLTSTATPTPRLAEGDPVLLSQAGNILRTMPHIFLPNSPASQQLQQDRQL